MLRSLTLSLSLLLLFSLNACVTLPAHKPQISISNIVPVNATLLEQSFNVILRVQNPNDQPLKAKGVDFNVSLNGQFLGKGFSNTEIDIPAYGEKEITISMHTSLLTWLKQLNGKNWKKGEFDYEVEGHLNPQGIGSLSFKKQGKIKL